MVKAHTRTVPTKVPSGKSGSEASTDKSTSSTPSPEKTAASGEASPDPSKAEGKEKPPEKKAEPEKSAADGKPKDDKKLSRGWAELMDREATLTTEKKTLATEREGLKPFIDAKKKAETSVLDAMEALFGADALDKAQAEYLERTRGSKSPETLAREAAQKAVDEARRQDQAKADAEEKERKEKTEREAQAKVEGWKTALVAAANAAGPEAIRAIESFGHRPEHSLQIWFQQHPNQEPTDFAQVLKEHEEYLRAQLKAKGFDVPAAQTGTQVQQTSTTITPALTGDVPVTRRGGREETAQERAQRIVREAFPDSYPSN